MLPETHSTCRSTSVQTVRIFASNIICLSVGLESRQSARIFKYSPSIGYKYRYTHTNTAQQVCFAHLRLARVVPTVSTFRRESQHRLMNVRPSGQPGAIPHGRMDSETSLP
ncbi:hypothetical protein CABS01_01901 [Colletotrichum abscissum]|uniref:Uncharacterized protein n=1 Tax=Colletotrichum tamarilloi TaxID=1209934 RepID=A0ABQ9RS23_9PEZI|nr:uncharacterized protein CTAM01_00745 [Colletotrichum tamarilloi]XP_060398469.1 uncharacterized protein CABS01_01901 [Colletotrichum abscissum]KAK1496094.1 hypothetical protein CABS01_01901 [Colletotrichum abscissum]KAK1511815.1 hypothetical protein CTAM01_00745 [Colletotrichum tamarilloi]